VAGKGFGGTARPGSTVNCMTVPSVFGSGGLPIGGKCCSVFCSTTLVPGASVEKSMMTSVRSVTPWIQDWTCLGVLMRPPSLPIIVIGIPFESRNS